MDSEIKDILEFLIDKDIFEYKCFDILKEKIITDEKFRDKIKEGIKNNKQPHLKPKT